MTRPRDRWSKLRPELVRRQRSGEPVETTVQHVPNAILEVGDDHVIVRSSRGHKARTILAQEINNGDIEQYIGRRRIILALRELADSLP